MAQREQNLDRKVAMIDKKEHALDDKSADCERRVEALKHEQEQLGDLT